MHTGENRSTVPGDALVITRSLLRLRHDSIPICPEQQQGIPAAPTVTYSRLATPRLVSAARNETRGKRLSSALMLPKVNLPSRNGDRFDRLYGSVSN